MPDPGSFDLNIAYHSLRDAARRLVAVYSLRASIGGIEDPAIQAIADIFEQVEAVASRGIAQQRAVECAGDEPFPLPNRFRL
jgi:hypothetical protein